MRPSYHEFGMTRSSHLLERRGGGDCEPSASPKPTSFSGKDAAMQTIALVTGIGPISQEPPVAILPTRIVIEFRN